MATTILQFPNPIRSPYLKPEDSPCGQVLGKAFSETFRGSVRSNGKRRTQSLVTANHQKPDEQVATEGETVRSKWREIGPNITKLQRQAISELPPVMTNRCKAVMKQIICFSDDKGGLRDLLSAWARIMNPRRADWLSVLKQLKDTEHPFYVQVAEFALLEESFEANTRDYTKLIHFYGKQKQLEDAERSFSCMKERGLLYDQITLTAMIHMYSKAGHHKKAEQIFEELLLLGQPLDQRSYGSMVTWKELRGCLMQCRLQVLFLMPGVREGGEAGQSVGVSSGFGEGWSFGWERSFSCVGWVVWKVGRCERS
ncbi:unnamed protein product [Linum tenue]|uniref:Pentatricopeptide repeat-containing protein n=1 Tax=Linum tenue TaxID=586396 RepID=A0AAV0ITS2_9ROSI|nr:unnamed protein product [Linum tenue]